MEHSKRKYESVYNVSEGNPQVNGLRDTTEELCIQDTNGLGTVGKQPLALVKAKSVEVEFVDEPSYVKVAKVVPKQCFWNS